MNGKLNDPCWSSTAFSDPFGDIEGDVKPTPSFLTQAKVLWDDDYLYIGAKMEEPNVWATLTLRDSVIFQDNDFEIFIDPDGDSHNYYEIEINALNTVWDLRLPKPYKDGGSAIDSWDIEGLITAVAIDGKLNSPKTTCVGWTLEMAIPWKALGEYAKCASPPIPGDHWRINFSRVEWKVDVVDGRFLKRPNLPEDNWVWSPQGAIDMHRPERWGYLLFADAETDSATGWTDPSHEARCWLTEIYYAQKSYFQLNGRYSGELAHLQLSSIYGDIANPMLIRTEKGYIASVTLAGSGENEVWCIQDDSLIWKS